MNQLKHIVHALPRHANPSSPIGGRVSSGYQINAASPSIFRNGSHFRRVDLPSTLRSQSFTGYRCDNERQPLFCGKPPMSPNDHNPKASMGRVGRSGSAKTSDNNAEKPAQLAVIPNPRNYAQLIADYSEAIEMQNVIKSKPPPTGLLSRLPIESIVSTLSPFEASRKRFKRKLRKTSRASLVDKPSAIKQTNNNQANSIFKTQSQNPLPATKSASQRRDYYTQNNDASSDNKHSSTQNPSTTNDFDAICELTESRNQRNNRHTEPSNTHGINYKVNDRSHLVGVCRLSKANSNNNQSQFVVIASEEKIELPVTTRSVGDVPRAEKSCKKIYKKHGALPWWTWPEPHFDKKYEKSNRNEVHSSRDIEIIYSEEMKSDTEISKRQDKSPSSLHDKLASLSKTKEYIKEELEKHKGKRKRKSDKQTDTHEEEIRDGKRRSIKDKSDDKSVKMNKVIDISRKNSAKSDSNAIPQSKQASRTDSIDQEYRKTRVTEPLKPLEKKKDGTLIDYGLKVPTRRPKKKQQQPSKGPPKPEKKNSAKNQIPRASATQEQQQLLNLGKLGENCKNNSHQCEESKKTRSNYAAEGITERLVNSLQQLRSEQMFRRVKPQEDSCHCNCHSSICALESAINADSEERPEKQLIYSAWLNRNTPSDLHF